MRRKLSKDSEESVTLGRGSKPGAHLAGAPAPSTERDPQRPAAPPPSRRRGTRTRTIPATPPTRGLCDGSLENPNCKSIHLPRGRIGQWI